MGKRGIYINSRPRLSSSAGAFEKRGDKWMTSREGILEYGRNLDTEDPERDWWFAYNGDTKHTRAYFANPQQPHMDPKGKPITESRARINISLGLKRQLGGKRITEPDKGGRPIVPKFLQPELTLEEQKEFAHRREKGKEEQKELQRKILSIKTDGPKRVVDPFKQRPDISKRDK